MSAERTTVPKLTYDGWHIEILWDNHDEAVQWFEQYMGWKARDQFKSGENDWFIMRRQTHLGFGTWIKSYIPKIRPHVLADRTAIEGHVRWCWRTRDLEAVHSDFQKKGIRVTDLYAGPGGHYYFDFWATAEGVRLTAEGDDTIAEDAPLFVPSWTRIGVSDLQASIDWYSQYLGMQVFATHMKEGYAVMHLALEHHPDDVSTWVLERLPEGAHKECVNSPVRPYVVMHDTQEFQTYHNILLQSGVKVSDMEGNVSLFHLYDPDGNRFTISR
ncbi:VOC family protein [Paenibacillus sp. NPDC056579]|uniref:VOC family protein n=1 Tax=Paenibacillus sp. NPDC056579 TaxID=3345871 RepID=UPI0036932D3D